MRIFEKFFTTSLSLLKSKTGKKLVAAWGLSMLLLSATVAQGEEYRVGSYAEFKAALENSALKNGDTIALSADIVFDSSATTLILPAEVTQITIKSANSGTYEIKGNTDNPSTRLFESKSGSDVTITLENITFSQGYLEGDNNNGGAILSGGNLIIKKSDSDAISTVFNTNASIGGVGGAISSEAKVTIESGNNSFYSNIAIGGGGIAAGNVEISGGVNEFSSNFGTNIGGGILVGATSAESLASLDMNSKPADFAQLVSEGNKVTLSGTDNSFIGNIAGYVGGGIFGDVDITQGKNFFMGNFAVLGGGAIAGGNINISGGTNNFLLNGEDPDGEKTMSGGAVLAFESVNISGGTNKFEENKAESGGAITTNILNISGGTNVFDRNEGGMGGVVYAGVDPEKSAGYVNITGGTNTFSLNKGESGGGAIYAANDENDNPGTVNITGGTNKFEKNTAEYSGGGAIYSTGEVNLKGSSNNTFEENIINGNSDGGAIYSAGNVTLSEQSANIFKNNQINSSPTSRTGHGGAIYSTGNVSLTGESKNTFEGNKTGGATNGGAIYSMGVVTLAGKSVNIFQGNEASYHASDDGNLESDSYISGGAIYAKNDINIADGENTFKNNKALYQGSWGKGGAVYSETGVNITGGTNLFDSNLSRSGGAVYSDSSVTISGGTNTFTANQADAGSAISSEGTIQITGGVNTFSENLANDGTIGSTYVIYAKNKITIDGGTNLFYSNNNQSVIHSNEVEIKSGETTIKEAADSGIIFVEKLKIAGGINKFINNASAAGTSGGAIAGVLRGEQTEIIGGENTFEGNNTTNNGGAIAASNVLISGGTNVFKNNDASGSSSLGFGLGGAIFTKEGNITISGGENTFEGNTTTYFGGALAAGEGDVVLSGGTNTFKGNKTTGSSGDSGGGAIAVINTKKVTISGDGVNIFSDNVAVNDNETNSGAISGYTEISGGTNFFAGNKALADNAYGGAIGIIDEAYGGDISISGGWTTFAGNKAEGAIIANGGAIYNEFGAVKISGGTAIFNENAAIGNTNTAKGGAIYAKDIALYGKTTLAAFYNNTADVGSSLYAANEFKMEDGATLMGNGEFAAQSFDLKNSVISPDGEMIFKSTAGNATVNLSGMQLKGEFNGSLAAAESDRLHIARDILYANIDENVTTRLGGKVTSEPDVAGLLKEGNGVLRIIGNEHYYNAIINGGSFMLGEIGGEGTLTGNVDVFAGKLGGNGKIIGKFEMEAGSVISPGNSIGTITIDGDSLLEGTTLEIEVDKTGNSDKIIVTGNNHNATLKNSTIKFTALDGFAFDTPYEYLIVEGGIVIDSGGNNVSIDNFLLSANFPSTTDISSVIITKDPNALLTLANTPNQKAVALMAMNDVNDMVYLIFNNPNDAARVLALTGGEIHASTQSALTESTRHIREAVLSRMGENDGNSIWAQMIGSWDSYDGDNISKTKSKTRGIIAGFDKDNGSRRTGIALGVSKSENRIDNLSSTSNANSTHLALYNGSSDYSNSYQTRFGAGVSWHSIDSDRHISFSNESLRAEYSARTIQLFGEIGKRHTRDNKGYIEPFLGLAYTSTNFGGFNERSNNAAGGALAVTGKTHNSTYANLGIRLLSKAHSDKMTLKASASWQHLLGGNEFKTTQRLLSGGVTPFEIAGAPIAKNALVLDLGFDYQTSKNFSWGLSYNSQIAKQMQNDAINLNFKWKY